MKEEIVKDKVFKEVAVESKLCQAVNDYSENCGHKCIYLHEVIKLSLKIRKFWK